MHKHLVDVLDATVDSDSGHGDQEIPYDERARGLHRARVVGMAGSVGEGVAERQGGLGVESRFDTDRPIARGSAGEAVLMKQAWQALCRARATLGNGLN